MEKRSFGKTSTGQEVEAYTIRNKTGMEAEILSYGATIRTLKIQLPEGTCYDVVLGYDTLKEYEENTCYFGAVIGRNANRIADARCQIEQQEYQLESNDHGNNLHSGRNGFHNVVWGAECPSDKDNAIVLVYHSKEGHQGFPGNMDVKLTYRLTDAGELIIDYQAVTDQTTVANFTNHSYYNLDGHESGSIENQEIEILASYYTPVADNRAIPTGEMKSVSNTPMDFRIMRPIGQKINSDFGQLECSGGYDHNYVLDKADRTVQLAARARSEKSGLELCVYTDRPGVQFYSGNFIQDHPGKDGAAYRRRQGFCLETQAFPNAINEKNFESPLLKPEEIYHSQTKMSFHYSKEQ